MSHWGAVPVSSVLPFQFATYGPTNSESITMTGFALGDIRVYKGTSMTERASSNGIVLLDSDGTDIDGITGIHGFSIDTSDNSDAGFYASGSFYTVVVSSITVSSQVVSFVAGTFRLIPVEIGTVGTNGLTRASFAADTGLQSIRSNTAQAGGASTITLDTGASSVNSFYNTASILLTGGTGAGQFAVITGYVGSTRVATVNTTWAVNPDNTTTFALFPAAATASDIAAAVRTNLTTELGRIDEAVSAADDATLSAIASLSSAISALNNLSAAGVRTAVGLASANLDTQLSALASYVDTEVAAIKAKTDLLTFGTGNALAANVKRVNDVALTGSGTTLAPWEP